MCRNFGNLQEHPRLSENGNVQNCPFSGSQKKEALLLLQLACGLVLLSHEEEVCCIPNGACETLASGEVVLCEKKALEMSVLCVCCRLCF